ncbi:zinc-binding dehydrogenase [Microbispora rosea]|uniref:zinc-binding dehydrogenase n=1 Tax=Microbispora rosea TaxID=58117 RepID=UPI0033C90280
MQVVQAVRFGGPGVLEVGEAPDPVAGPGQVVVDVSFADTLFLDIVIRRGVPGPWAVRPPYVPGFGVAGRVLSAGDGVDRSWVGRDVVGRPGAFGPGPDTGDVEQAAAGFSPTGGYAERATLSTGAMFPVPDGLGLDQAAALINDGFTAMQIAEAAGIRSGERVLVMPAGGGLGSLLVQLAHAAGAQVVAAARGRRKCELARSLGADAAIDYAEEGWPERVREATDGKGLDVVLDGVGGEIGRLAFPVAAPGGRFFAFGSPSGSFTEVDPGEARERDVTVVGLMQLPMRPGDERRLPAQALAQAAEGRITPVIGQTFPLRDAAAAHAAMEARGVIGKTLLLPEGTAEAGL